MAFSSLVTDHSLVRAFPLWMSVYPYRVCVCGLAGFLCIWQREQSLWFFKWNELSGSTLNVLFFSTRLALWQSHFKVCAHKLNQQQKHHHHHHHNHIGFCRRSPFAKFVLKFSSERVKSLVKSNESFFYRKINASTERKLHSNYPNCNCTHAENVYSSTRARKKKELHQRESQRKNHVELTELNDGYFSKS